MLPALWPGDVVSVLREPLEEVRRGDLVLAVREGRLFLHRFVAHAADGGFIARGDSVSQPDLPYHPKAFLGKVVTVDRRGSAIAPSSRPGLPQRLLSFSLCHVGMLRRAALYIHRRRNAHPLEETTSNCM